MCKFGRTKPDTSVMHDMYVILGISSIAWGYFQMHSRRKQTMASKWRELTLAIKEQIIRLGNKGRKKIEIAKITGYDPSTIVSESIYSQKIGGKQHTKWTTKIDKSSNGSIIKQVIFERSQTEFKLFDIRDLIVLNQHLNLCQSDQFRGNYIFYNIHDEKQRRLQQIPRPTGKDDQNGVSFVKPGLLTKIANL